MLPLFLPTIEIQKEYKMYTNDYQRVLTFIQSSPLALQRVLDFINTLEPLGICGDRQGYVAPLWPLCITTAKPIFSDVQNNNPQGLEVLKPKDSAFIANLMDAIEDELSLNKPWAICSIGTADKSKLHKKVLVEKAITLHAEAIGGHVLLNFHDIVMRDILKYEVITISIFPYRILKLESRCSIVFISDPLNKLLTQSVAKELKLLDEVMESVLQCSAEQFTIAEDLTKITVRYNSDHAMLKRDAGLVWGDFSKGITVRSGGIKADFNAPVADISTPHGDVFIVDNKYAVVIMK